MKAVRIHDPHDIRFEDLPRPKPGPGEVLIRVLATGFCGTDLEICDGSMAYFTRGMARYPVTPGHEWVGEVTALGDGVTGFSPGDRVVGECSVGCGICGTCKAGHYHQCPTRTETGILNRDGGFAEFIAFPAAYLHRISKNVDLRAAALVEPAAIALHGVRTAEVSPRDHVVIHGDGQIGLLLLMVVRAFGARRVTVVGATPGRLALARKIGADDTVDVMRNDIARRLQEIGLPDVSIEATGQPEAAATALRCTRPGGRVVLQGLFGGRLLNGFDLDQIVINTLSVRGALGSPNIWPDVIDLIERKQIDPLQIVSHSLPLARFSDGIRIVERREGLKVVAVQEG